MHCNTQIYLKFTALGHIYTLVHMYVCVCSTYLHVSMCFKQCVCKLMCHMWLNICLLYIKVHLWCIAFGMCSPY